MRISTLDVAAYGRLSAFRAEGLAEHGVVVLLGANESGKSTLFSFLVTSLFGFSPARRDLHPFDPWSGAHPEGSVEFVLGDGSTASVRRRLRSQPDGRLVVAGEETAIGNRPVPWVGRVTSQVYEGLHAVSLFEAGELSKAAWAELEERLLGGAAFPFLRPAREAARALEEAANGLWREDRRGKPRARDLEVRLRDARKEREEAAARATRLSDLRDERSATESRLDEVLAERVALRSRLELSEQLEKDHAEVQRLEQEVQRHRDAAPEEPGDEALLEQADDLEALAREASEERHDRLLLDSIQADEKEALADVAEHVSSALEAAPNEEVRDAIAALDGTDVRRSMRRVVDASRAVESAERDVRTAVAAFEALEDRARPVAGEPTTTQLDERVRALRDLRGLRARLDTLDATLRARREQIIFGRVFAVIGVLATLYSFWLSDTGLVIVLLLGLGAFGAAAWLLLRKPVEAAEREQVAASLASECARLGLGGVHEADAALDVALSVRARIEARTPDAQSLERAGSAVGAAEESLRAGNQELETARELLEALLDGIPVATGRLELLDLSLAEDLMRLQHAVRELTRIRSRRPEAQERARGRRQRAEVLAASLGRTLSDDALADVAEWTREAREAVARRDRRTVKREDLPRLVREHTQAVNRLHQHEAEFEALPGAPSGTPAAELGTRDRVVLEERVDTLEREREALLTKAGKLEQEAADLASRPGVDDVDGETLALREELLEVERERDRKVLLARILRVAEKRYRERHQPDVFRRAAAHLRTISNGRYVGLEVSEEDGQPFLEVRAKGEEFPLPARPPLSRGALEQIHLALRLALADQVDGSEPLPLVLDELFVNWDPDRAGQGLSVLRRIGERRQVLLFTCHPDFAERARAEAGALVVTLPGIVETA